MRKDYPGQNRVNYYHYVWTMGVACLFAVLLPLTVKSQFAGSAPTAIPGQTATKLPDGQVLLLGGESVVGGLAIASIWDPVTNRTESISTRMNRGRAWHTSTLMPDGFVLILGGLGNGNEIVSTVELFDPVTQTFTILPSDGVTPRARHTATLLTDGQVLLAGGVGASGQTLKTAELWDAIQHSRAGAFGLNSDRRDHSATLLADGSVLLWGGVDAAGNARNNGDLYHPVTGSFTSVAFFPSSLLPHSSDSPSLVASIPLDRSVDVSRETMISLRFSKPLRVETVNTNTVSLNGPNGLEQIFVIPAENGSLAFITPEADLLPGSTYTVSVNGAIDKDGLVLSLSGISFTTEGGGTSGSQSASDSSSSSDVLPVTVQPQTPIPSAPTTSSDGLVWIGKLKDGKPHSDWQDLPPLQAPPGVTALSGQVLNLAGLPLANVILDLEDSEKRKKSKKIETDETGRFLLTELEAGWQELIIDGRRGRIRQIPESAPVGPGEDHGVFEYGIEIKAGKTTVLPFTIWLPEIDKANAVKLPSPLTSETVITSPKIPGLEVRIPANAVIYDHERKPVDEMSLTQIPLDRTPFPLPPHVDVPIYFTAQPGGTYIKGPNGIGVRIHYPNLGNVAPGTEFNFWHYSPGEKWFYAGEKGWWVYGKGRVTANGTQIIPHPGVSVYELTGAMVAPPNLGPDDGPQPDCEDDCDGDPVNLYTGLFLRHDTDLVLPGLMPIRLDRTYRNRDTRSRGFGIGANHSYDTFIVGDTFPYTFAEIILPDGGRVRYDRISPGTSFEDAIYEHTATPGRFYRSRIDWVDALGYQLTFKDGTRWIFEEGFNATRPGQAGLLHIEDRHGNYLSINRDTAGNITKIVSSSGRWVEFTNDPVNNRITQAKDNIGRTYSYAYDASGRLWKVTDPENGVTEYLYDGAHNVTSVKNPRGFTIVTNEYDANNRVKKQTIANGGTYQFTYTLDGTGKVTQTDVTDPRGNITRTAFNSSGYTTSTTRAVGRSEQQVTTYNRQTGTNHKDNVTDALNRKTTYTYDDNGNVLTVTRLADTPEAVTTTYTYEPNFNQVATITDPLNHATSFFYDSIGNLERVRDANNNETMFTYNTEGQQLTATTPAGTTQFVYEFGDLGSVIDPMGNLTNRGLDAIGRLQSMTNPLGLTTVYGYDNLNRLTGVTDPLTGLTQFGYDPNSNLLSVSDAKAPSGVTAYTYDNMDRLQIRTDPLLKSESYVYDAAGNLTIFRDRKLQATTYTYDALTRRTSATYADGSSTTYTYDIGNRLIQINDSIAGLITRTYDGLDRLTSEQTPQGTVGYTYDAAGRRETMTVPGQALITYTYDDGNRLTQITQGTSIVQFGYDAANRRTSLTLPNNILVEYGYDAASRVTSITYKQNGTTLLGDLTYEYDKAGNRTKIGGTWARTGMPQPLTTTSYDAANRQLTFGDKTLTYDDNGNLQSITDSNGTTLYSWNARNQLVAIDGPSVNASFVYDGMGRREKKTINGSLTEFLYDGINPVQESSGVNILANILPGLGIDEFINRTNVVSGVSSNFLTDPLGSTVAVTDNAGAVQIEYTYEPFGRTAASGTSDSNPFQYTGRENEDSGIYYYRARYYHPELQRFVSQDPIKFRGGDTNLYAYVGNNPIINTDPFGLIKYKQALCSLIDKTPDKNCMCTWRCYCPRGYILGGMSSVIKAPCDQVPQVTCFKPEPSDYGLMILIIILSSVDGPLPFGDAMGMGLAAGALAR